MWRSFLCKIGIHVWIILRIDRVNAIIYEQCLYCQKNSNRRVEA